jgi:hypothetical protein
MSIDPMNTVTVSCDAIFFCLFPASSRWRSQSLCSRKPSKASSLPTLRPHCFEGDSRSQRSARRSRYSQVHVASISSSRIAMTLMGWVRSTLQKIGMREKMFGCSLVSSNACHGSRGRLIIGRYIGCRYAQTVELVRECKDVDCDVGTIRRPRIPVSAARRQVCFFRHFSLLSTTGHFYFPRRNELGLSSDDEAEPNPVLRASLAKHARLACATLLSGPAAFRKSCPVLCV